MTDEEEYTYTYEGMEDFGFGGDMSEQDMEIVALESIYPDCVKRDEDKKGIMVKLVSLTKGVPDCVVHFVFADGYPTACPPLKLIELDISKEDGSCAKVFDRVKRNMLQKLYRNANLLLERGETSIVSYLLEDLSRMMIVAAQSSALVSSSDACSAFTYSMDYVETDSDFVNHPLIGSLFSMVTTDVLLMIMQQMDAGTLLRFSGTCRTFKKLLDDHPELIRKCVIKQYGKEWKVYGYSTPDKDLRWLLHQCVSKDKKDPIVGRILAQKQAEKDEEAAKMAAKKRRQLVCHGRYNHTPHFDTSGPLNVHTPRPNIQHSRRGTVLDDADD